MSCHVLKLIINKVLLSSLQVFPYSSWRLLEENIKVYQKMGRVPDRWFDYTKCGNAIDGVPIISFKTPLSKKFHRPHPKAHGEFVEKDQEFTPAMLVKTIKGKSLQLAAVIDLTFTFRYYSGIQELEENYGIPFIKIKCEGKSIPKEEIINQVADVFNNVIYENQKNDTKKVVGIHCTHGLNRTGYIVCRYLIEWLNMEPEKAVELFNKARGHDMERENYLEDLKDREPSQLYEDWVKNENKSDFYEKAKLEASENHNKSKSDSYCRKSRSRSPYESNYNRNGDQRRDFNISYNPSGTKRRNYIYSYESEDYNNENYDNPYHNNRGAYHRSRVSYNNHHDDRRYYHDDVYYNRDKKNSGQYAPRSNHYRHNRHHGYNHHGNNHHGYNHHGNNRHGYNHHGNNHHGYNSHDYRDDKDRHHGSYRRRYDDDNYDDMNLWK